MGRDRKYASDAERQRAYRERVRQEEARLREELQQARAGVKRRHEGRVPAWKRRPVPNELLKKLARIMNMLGSPNDAERDMASRAAAKMVMGWAWAPGLSWPGCPSGGWGLGPSLVLFGRFKGGSGQGEDR